MSRRAKSVRRGGAAKNEKARTISVVDYLFEGEQLTAGSRTAHQKFGKMKELVRDAPAALAHNGGHEMSQLNSTRHRLLNKLGICNIIRSLTIM